METLCRCCMRNTPGGRKIFKDDLFANKLTMCTDVSVLPHDGLPQTICAECQFKVNNFYDFREECRNSDRVLRSLRNENTEIFLEDDSTVQKNVINNKFTMPVNKPTFFVPNLQILQESPNVSINVSSESTVSSVPKTKPKVSRSSIHNETTIYKCDICEKEVTGYKKFREHTRNHVRQQKVSCGVCKKSIAARYLKSHYESHGVQYVPRMRPTLKYSNAALAQKIVNQKSYLPQEKSPQKIILSDHQRKINENNSILNNTLNINIKNEANNSIESIENDEEENNQINKMDTSTIDTNLNEQYLANCKNNNNSNENIIKTDNITVKEEIISDIDDEEEKTSNDNNLVNDNDDLNDADVDDDDDDDETYDNLNNNEDETIDENDNNQITEDATQDFLTYQHPLALALGLGPGSLSKAPPHIEKYNVNGCYVCDKCRKQFIDWRKFREHHRGHARNFKVPCPKCNKYVASKYLKGHLKRHGDNESMINDSILKKILIN